MSTALVTFALAYSITDLATFFNSFTGGDAGMYLPANVGVGGMTFSGSSKGMLLLVVVLMIVVGFIHLAMLHSRSGRIAISVGEAESAAAVFATRVRWVKLAVWAWAAALAGLAGVLYGLSVGYVTASQWQVNLTIFVLVGGLIGGSRSASGAWIGGLLVGGLPILLQTVVPVAATYIAYGAILLGALLVGGKGLAEFVERGFVWAYVVIRRPR